MQTFKTVCNGIIQLSKLNALKRLKISKMETTEIYKRIKLSNSNNLIAIIQQEYDEFFITVFDEFSDYEGGIYIEDVAYTQQDAEIKTDKIINNIIKKY